MESPDKYRAAGREVANVLSALGATTWEQAVLLGIGFAESLWNPKAVGKADERGVWQIEKSDVDLETQARNALAQLRRIYEALGSAANQKWYAVIDTDPRPLSRIVRAAWQLGKTGPDTAIRYWLFGKNDADRFCVKKRWEAINPGKEGKLPGETDDAARERIMTRGGRLGASDFIDYVSRRIPEGGTIGADKDALLKGQEAYSKAMEAMDWRPRDYVEGSISQEITYKPGETPEPQTWLGRQIKGIIEGVKEGAQVVFGAAGRYVLPAFLLAVMVGTAGGLIRRLWRVSDKNMGRK